MFAIRQIIEDPQDTIEMPQELRHRRCEVIFIALDSLESPSPNDAVRRFRGKGKGGSVERLLKDRLIDRAHER